MERLHLKIFCSDTTTKMLFQPLKQCKKTVQFYHQKEIDMLKLGCTFPNLANNCLHKSLMKNSTHFAKMVRICARKLERI